MISFKDFMLMERVLSPGLNPSHEKYREQHRNEIHDILRNSYKKSMVAIQEWVQDRMKNLKLSTMTFPIL